MIMNKKFTYIDFGKCEENENVHNLDSLIISH